MKHSQAANIITPSFFVVVGFVLFCFSQYSCDFMFSGHELKDIYVSHSIVF